MAWQSHPEPWMIKGSLRVNPKETTAEGEVLLLRPACPISCCSEKKEYLNIHPSMFHSRYLHFIHPLCSPHLFLQTRPENATFSFQRDQSSACVCAFCACLFLCWGIICTALASTGETADSSPPLSFSLCGLISISKSCDPAGKPGKIQGKDNHQQ